jgi:hypothetical protein
MRTTAALVAVAALALVGCGDDEDAPETTTTTTTEATTTTSSTTTSTTEAPTTSESTTTVPGGGGEAGDLQPGDPCSLEEGVPDCIDPDGDGEGTYLLDGAGCIAGSPDPALCTDLDGDGYAGYPDSEGTDPGAGETADLPECGPGVPVPCRNPDGSVDEG